MDEARIMRTIYWCLLISAALFISGIAFIVAAGRTAQAAEPAQTVVMGTPVASVQQIMRGIVAPASTVVYRSVATTVSASGIEEKAPRNDDEWADVARNAAMLAESGNLLMLGDRAVDRGDWITISQQLVKAAMMAVKAAEAKSTDDIITAGGEINITCANCHAKYQRQ
jgi:hypothetical protein